MRTRIILWLWLSGLSFCHGQDLIVTTANDSINAKIYKERNNAVYFYFYKDGDTRNTVLTRAQIASVQKGFFAKTEVPEDFKRVKAFNGKRWHLRADAGFAYQTGKLPRGLDPVSRDYLKRLKSGFHWGVNAHYSISRVTALGIDVNTFRVNHEELFPSTDSEGITLSNDLNITFIGPSLMNRIASARRSNAFFSQVALGYFSYKDRQRAGTDLAEITGGTIGMVSNFGYEIGLTDNLAFSLSTSVTLGSLRKITVEELGRTIRIDLEENGGDHISLGRINLMAGLKILW